MNDVVISGRIPVSLFRKVRELGKSNTEIINEALELYVAKNNTKEPCIHGVYKETSDDDINTIHEVVNGFKTIKRSLMNDDEDDDDE